MERFILRDPFESDKRVEVNWWLKDDVCDYCVRRNCDHCAYKKRRFHLIY